MGIDPDVEFGNDCLACFDANETPEIVYASFIDVEWCPWVPAVNRHPNPNKTWRLTQTVDPCIWQLVDAFVNITFGVNVPAGPPNISRVTFGLFVPPGAAFSADGILCGTFFTNSLVVGNCVFPDVACHGGICQIAYKLGP